MGTFKNLHLVCRGTCEGGRMGGGSSCLKHKAGSAHSHTQTQMVKILFQVTRPPGVSGEGEEEAEH